MSLNETDKLGQTIGGLSQEQDDIKANISPDESIPQTQLFANEGVEISGNSTGVAIFLAETSFVIDHPVYGDIDSATLAIDGGYASTAPGGFVFPANFPLIFAVGTANTEELWNIDY